MCAQDARVHAIWSNARVCAHLRREFAWAFAPSKCKAIRGCAPNGVTYKGKALVGLIHKGLWSLCVSNYDTQACRNCVLLRGFAPKDKGKALISRKHKGLWPLCVKAIGASPLLDKEK